MLPTVVSTLLDADAEIDQQTGGGYDMHQVIGSALKTVERMVEVRRWQYREDLDLPAGLDLHSLRRSYATHLIEDGWDPKFVQTRWTTIMPAPHRFMSSDYRVRILRRGLNATVNDALSFGEDRMKRQVDYAWRLRN